MELKRTYALYGKAHSGKTSTLNKLIELLEKKLMKVLLMTLMLMTVWLYSKLKISLSV